jgi:hypothetical protein
MADVTYPSILAYQTIPLSGNAFIPNAFLGSNMTLTLVHGTCPCTLNNMTNIYPGQFGMVHVINSSSGSEALTLSGSQYVLTVTPPYTSDPNSATDWFYTVNANGLVLFGEADLPPTISNTSPNLLLGGDGLTSNWSAGQATLTTGATCTSPIGGTNTCALLTEDTSNAVHRVVQNTTLPGSAVITDSAFAKINSGTRYIELRLADNTFSNVASLTFDPVTCSDDPSIAAGTGPAFIGAGALAAPGSHGTIPRPNGFCEGWIAATLGGATPVFETIQLSTPSGDSYLGTGESNLIWRPAARNCVSQLNGVCTPP